MKSQVDKVFFMSNALEDEEKDTGLFLNIGRGSGVMTRLFHGTNFGQPKMG